MKNIVKFLKDRRGVSPVIGVILMVAITVVLGAVVAAFAYGYVGQTEKAPNVVLSAMDDPADSASLLIRHSGGETIPSGDWKASVSANQSSATTFSTSSPLSDNLSVGKVITVTNVTTAGTANITAGWYHVAVVSIDTDTLLLDTNVLVR